jgi:hypothetical protein
MTPSVAVMKIMVDHRGEGAAEVKENGSMADYLDGIQNALAKLKKAKERA